MRAPTRSSSIKATTHQSPHGPTRSSVRQEEKRLAAPPEPRSTCELRHVRARLKQPPVGSSRAANSVATRTDPFVHTAKKRNDLRHRQNLVRPASYDTFYLAGRESPSLRDLDTAFARRIDRLERPYGIHLVCFMYNIAVLYPHKIIKPPEPMAIVGTGPLTPPLIAAGTLALVQVCIHRSCAV